MPAPLVLSPAHADSGPIIARIKSADGEALPRGIKLRWYDWGCALDGRGTELIETGFAHASWFPPEGARDRWGRTVRGRRVHFAGNEIRTQVPKEIGGRCSITLHLPEGERRSVEPAWTRCTDRPLPPEQYEVLLRDDDRAHFVALMVECAESRYAENLDSVALAGAFIDAARSLAAKALPGASNLNSPNAVRRFLLAHLAPMERECFVCVWLSSSNSVITWDEVSQGTLTSCTVYPREIARLALRRNAAAVILAHNHPSGVTTPSMADRVLTDAIADVLGLIEVRVLDHMICAGTHIASFMEMGIQPGSAGRSRQRLAHV